MNQSRCWAKDNGGDSPAVRAGAIRVSGAPGAARVDMTERTRSAIAARLSAASRLWVGTWIPRDEAMPAATLSSAATSPPSAVKPSCNWMPVTPSSASQIEASSSATNPSGLPTRRLSAPAPTLSMLVDLVGVVGEPFGQFRGPRWGVVERHLRAVVAEFLAKHGHRCLLEHHRAVLAYFGDPVLHLTTDVGFQ